MPRPLGEMVLIVSLPLILGAPIAAGLAEMGRRDQRGRAAAPP